MKNKACYNFFKRFFDIVFSLLALVILGPVLIIITLIIKSASPGSVFYRGIRTGRNGKSFKIFKFRSMVENAENLGGPSTAHDDHRFTPVGKILRKHKLDELPQLINILIGDMSFVGPRPQVEKYTKLYNKKELVMLSVRPGLTDFASIEFINLDEVLGNDNVDEKYLTQIEPQKNILRMKYTSEYSFIIDMKILYKTIQHLLKI